MDFGLQMGHGMQALIVEFLTHQNTRNDVILSPRNFPKTPSMTGVERMASYANGPVRQLAGDVMVDPQLYVAGKGTKSLRAFPHWAVCGGDIWANLESALYEVARLNEQCATDCFIAPATVIEHLDNVELAKLSRVSNLAKGCSGGRMVIQTIALSQDAMKSEETVDRLLLASESWDVDGFYLIGEHPKGEYLVSQPLWLYNLLSLIAGMKRAGKVVYVGYANHQILPAVLAGCDKLFSGNYINVRSFDRATFEEGEVRNSRPAHWYYAPQALSEFKVTTLDLAFMQDKLSLLKSPFMDDEYVGMLFGGLLPSDTAFDGRMSFLHYLICLNQQCALLNVGSYDAAFAAINGYCSTAESLIDGLRDSGVYDKGRSYADALPATTQAVAAFNSGWGFQMRQEWNELNAVR